MFFVCKAQTINSCRRGSTTCRLYSLYTHKPPLFSHEFVKTKGQHAPESGQEIIHFMKTTCDFRE
ncbi:hypothetical protein OUZ56_007206 [Daphnia magna]|uniref:Uncharacterized protein n=1 Tax=Daphnia magna TaxID=35525 RepID=A0ABQ9YXX7_9CRUS|nr:hypothetical protein OUZ56_007206 [Daphnia magna]